jgi:hypothetical protein
MAAFSRAVYLKGIRQSNRDVLKIGRVTRRSTASFSTWLKLLSKDIYLLQLSDSPAGFYKEYCETFRWLKMEGKPLSRYVESIVSFWDSTSGRG